MSILAKQTKTPRKTQIDNNLPKTKRILNIKMSAKGSPVSTFSLPGGRFTPLPHVSYATAYNSHIIKNENFLA